MQTNNIALADLRIGSKIICKDKIGEVSGYLKSHGKEMVMIAYEYENISGNKSTNEIFVNLNKILGIPITEEWLERFGLQKYSGSDIAYRIGDFTFFYKDFESDILENYWAFDISSRGLIRYVKCKYIHELQNAAKIITGTELTLK